MFVLKILQVFFAICQFFFVSGIVGLVLLKRVSIALTDKFLWHMGHQ
jgi:hypothetical protein